MKDFFKQKSVTKFRPYDVQDLLQPLISSHPHKASADQVRQNKNILLFEDVWWWDERKIKWQTLFEVSFLGESDEWNEEIRPGFDF